MKKIKENLIFSFTKHTGVQRVYCLNFSCTSAKNIGVIE